MKFLLGKKIEMKQIFDEQGAVMPVTLLKAGPCYVTQIKKESPDGYRAIQIGFEKIKKTKNLKKSMKGKHYRYLREFRIEEGAAEKVKELKLGDKIDVSTFQEGNKLKISGISKGKGFAGGVKRWGFVDKAKVHGATDMRRIGSVGARQPQRVIKGKKMAGRMGTERTTVKNLKVASIDKDNNILAIKGAVPGHRGTLLEIRGPI